jgi:DNA replication and repair protein RecF
MLLTAVQLRDFRSYASAQAPVGEQLTVVHGPNGSGKSNLLEAVCFGCVARSPRTRNDRELIRFGSSAARVLLALRDERGQAHEFSVGFGAIEQPGTLEKRLRFDGAKVQRLEEVPERPLAIVFVPDRLELVNGGPAVRRSHLDHLVAALWPARTSHRAEYAKALAQRNALIARIRSGRGSDSALDSWDLELARHALTLTSDREAAVQTIADGFRSRCATLGLAGDATLHYKPRCRSQTPEGFATELRERLRMDLERGFTTHGPHRDDLAILRDGRPLRAYGSQGERRLALLALLLAERAALAAARGHAPLMLLDDVTSELDSRRREALLDDLGSWAGQSMIATTDLSHVPGAGRAEVLRLRTCDGEIVREGETR